ncbi:hypothetical protein WD019_03030 [Fictibacillus sp. Mic-4]|uniref:hypothetical protein n=1 Tax=Fictibacillus sp. Mic-4 TaxID=3132826 RepID=UPI003CEB53D3
MTKNEIKALRAKHHNNEIVLMLLEEIERLEKTRIQQADRIGRQKKRLRELERKGMAK